MTNGVESNLSRLEFYQNLAIVEYRHFGRESPMVHKCDDIMVSQKFTSDVNSLQF